MTCFTLVLDLLIQTLTKGSLVADVLEQDVERLEELDAHVAPRLLAQDVQEEGKHVLLQEETEHKQEGTHRSVDDDDDDDLILNHITKKNYCLLQHLGGNLYPVKCKSSPRMNPNTAHRLELLFFRADLSLTPSEVNTEFNKTTVHYSTLCTVDISWCVQKSIIVMFLNLNLRKRKQTANDFKNSKEK